MMNNELGIVAMTAAKLGRMWVLLACGYSGLMLGCDGASPTNTNQPATAVHAEPDHGHEAPASYADAVKQLETMRNTIRDAFAKNDAEAAHGPLHDVGHLLESLPALADKAGLDETQKTSVKTAVEQLFGHFGKVDELMHGDTGTKYEDVSSKIDEAVTTLVGLASKG